jgi:hypothetical protein
MNSWGPKTASRITSTAVSSLNGMYDRVLDSTIPAVPSRNPSQEAGQTR